jgi:hypothetical protein
MMKTIKTGLLATAALLTISTLAHADALADLKAAIVGIDMRQASGQASVSLPRGYNVNPTADAAGTDLAVEEPFVDVKVSGYIKTGFIYSQVKTNGDDKADFDVEGGVNVKGSVQSALGEVGATIQAKWDIAEAANNAATFALRDDGLIGFWQFADTMKLEMGRGNGGRLENGIDKNTRRIWTVQNRRIRSENAGNGFFDRDAYNGFMGLAYASGPISLQIRAHDATRGIGAGTINADDDAIGVSAKAVYAGEVVGFEVSGGYWGEDGAVNLPVKDQTGVKYLIGAGTELNFIEGVPLSFSGQYGELHNGTQALKLSGSLGLTITDTISAGFGGGWTKITNTPAGIPALLPPNNNTAGDHEELVALAGVYYSPMTYLTLGLEGDWVDDSRPAISDGLTGAFVARYAF